MCHSFNSRGFLFTLKQFSSKSAFFLLFQPKEKKIVPGFCQLVSISNFRIEKFFLEAKLFGARAEEREGQKLTLLALSRNTDRREVDPPSSKVIFFLERSSEPEKISRIS